MVIIKEVILQPLASQEFTLHAQNKEETCMWKTHSRIHMEIYATVVTEYNIN